MFARGKKEERETLLIIIRATRPLKLYTVQGCMDFSANKDVLQIIVAVTFGSAFRALNYGKEMERNRDLSEASITLDRALDFEQFVRFFGANVMVSVATQQASNPVHTVANSLSLPGLQLITKKLELPVKIVFPRNLLGGASPGGNSADFMMLGLGDMAIPAMLLALVLCFDNRKSRETVNILDLHSIKGHKYIWYALSGYAVGLVTALAAGILTHSPQPALLYLVPSTLVPVIFISWLRKELVELWEGTMPNLNDKARQIEV
ncbi:hypothetical protein V6N11_011797 [Hibiscus sabdariffa]|uniref:Uncharacterized protein n=1 Tax=Hibiscus sabdariffa TaxID=183260 RepID=A0ABR2S9Q0_9ROSI